MYDPTTCIIIYIIFLIHEYYDDVTARERGCDGVECLDNTVC